MSGIPLITEISSVEEVQTWLKTYDDGQFSDFASVFKGLKGKAILGFSKEDLQEYCVSKPVGGALYNALHPPQKLTGIFRFAFCFFSSYSFVRYSNWSTQVGGIKKVIVHKRQGLEIPIRPKVLG